MIIDTHAHVVPGTMLAALRSEQRLFPSVRLHDGEAPRMDFGQGPGRPIQPRLHDLAQRRAWLASARVDRQLVGGWTDVYGYDLPPEEGADWARFYNEHMAKDAAALASLTALATVPLQDGALAARVLEEALDAGFKGAMIATQPKGTGGNLDDPSLDPFWETAARLGAAVVMHQMFVCGEPRLADYDLVNAIGRLVDSTIAVSRLLFSGHLLKHTGMKFVLCHGGAALPFGLGRLARSHTAQAGKVADPRKGFATMYFDSCVFDTDSLDYLVQKAGVERVMLGSDAPFPIGDPEPLKVFNGAKLSDAQKKMILSETARQVFRLRADAWTRS